MEFKKYLCHLISLFLVAQIILCASAGLVFAENITPDSMYEEGLKYLSSQGSVQDYAKGIAMILAAADAGSAKAMIEVGSMYTAGIGSEISSDFDEKSAPEVALSWYVKAAEAGEKEKAAEKIAIDAFTYFLGSEDGSIQEDDATALLYFEKAAEYGDPDAINMMVAFYTYGFGVEQNADKALELGCQLADRGDKEALYAMEENAYAYYAGTKDGIDINFATAFKYYEKLAQYGNERAMYNLGLLYEYGLGVSRDHEKAIEWMSKAVDAGYENAGKMLVELTANSLNN